MTKIPAFSIWGKILFANFLFFIIYLFFHLYIDYTPGCRSIVCFIKSIAFRSFNRFTKQSFQIKYNLFAFSIFVGVSARSFNIIFDLLNYSFTILIDSITNSFFSGFWFIGNLVAWNWYIRRLFSLFFFVYRFGYKNV